MDNTAKLGLFKIISEGSVAAGVRRIEAVTGQGVLDAFDVANTILTEAAAALKASGTSDMARRAAQIALELKEKDKEIERLNNRLTNAWVKDLLKNAKDVQGIKVIGAAFTGANADMLRNLCDQFKGDGLDLVAVVAGIQEEKGTVSFACACTKGAMAKGAHAGNIVREVAKIAGGSGGGRPDRAMAGGKDITKVDEALNALNDILEAQLSK